MRITSTEKKELFDVFIENKLKKDDFELVEDTNYFKIKYKQDYFSFSIQIVKTNEYLVKIRPTHNVREESISTNWENTKKRFSKWCGNLYEELNTITGWEENFRAYINIEIVDIDKKFEQDEKEKIKEIIVGIHEKIIALNLPSQNIEIIDKKLDDLSKKVDELSKFDWQALFIGTISSLLLTLIIPPEASGIIFKFISDSFPRLKLGN